MKKKSKNMLWIQSLLLLVPLLIGWHVPRVMYLYRGRFSGGIRPMFPSLLRLGPSPCFAKYEPDVASESLQTITDKEKKPNDYYWPCCTNVLCRTKISPELYSAKRWGKERGGEGIEAANMKIVKFEINTNHGKRPRNWRFLDDSYIVL